MIVPLVYVWLSHQCMVFQPVYGCPTGVRLSYMCMAVLHVYGCPSRFCTTCPNGVSLYYQCSYNLSWCMVVLSMFVIFSERCTAFQTVLYNLSERCTIVLLVLEQLVWTLYCYSTSPCTTSPNSVWLCYQCLNNLSEKCMVILSVLVQLVRTVYCCLTSACTNCPNSVWLFHQCAIERNKTGIRTCSPSLKPRVQCLNQPFTLAVL